MKKTLVAMAMVMASYTTTTQAAGNIGNPGSESRQSGIGIITGWVCDASEVNLILDNKEYIPTLYGIERQDVRQCDNAGFIALWDGSSIFGNWSSLGAGEHQIEAYADGVRFASRTFYVGAITEDGSAIVDRGDFFTIKDFPNAGDETTITWNQGLQNFVVVDATLSPPTDKPFPGTKQMQWRYESRHPTEENPPYILSLTRDKSHPDYDALLEKDIIPLYGSVQFSATPIAADLLTLSGEIKPLPGSEYYSITVDTGFDQWMILLDPSLNGTTSGWRSGRLVLIRY